MSFQNLSIATSAVRDSGLGKSGGLVERFADRLGVFVLLVMGLAMGGATVFSGL